MVITEAELRELWRNGAGRLPAFPAGTRFSPSAQDFIAEHKLQIQLEPDRPPPAAWPASIRQPPDSHLQLPTSSLQPPAWDRPALFPVALASPLPVCIECGQPVPHKPGHMTQLDAHHFGPKTHPRLKLRGRVDTLHAVTMLAAAEARRYQLPRLAEALDSLAAYCREIQSAEYNGRSMQPLVVLGRGEETLHQISHWPDRHLGMAHLRPGPADHAILHWLNVLRSLTRECELVAGEVYGPQPHTHDEAAASGSLPHALNRLSSAVYVLELLFTRGDLGWKAGGE
jgi:ethanolamine utilization cobalamin adenosyltransferase